MVCLIPLIKKELWLTLKWKVKPLCRVCRFWPLSFVKVKPVYFCQINSGSTGFLTCVSSGSLGKSSESLENNPQTPTLHWQIHRLFAASVTLLQPWTHTTPQELTTGCVCVCMCVCGFHRKETSTTAFLSGQCRWLLHQKKQRPIFFHFPLHVSPLSASVSFLNVANHWRRVRQKTKKTWFFLLKEPHGVT